MQTRREHIWFHSECWQQSRRQSVNESLHTTLLNYLLHMYIGITQKGMHFTNLPREYEMLVILFIFFCFPLFQVKFEILSPSS
jgi:hypothetical protein